MTTIEEIAHWAAQLRFAEIPPRVVEKARWQQASVLAASFAGLNDDGARRVLELARAQPGDTRLLAGGQGMTRAARAAACVANAAVSCTFDFDEILLLGHPGHSTVTVPLTLGETRGATWGDAVAAQVAANEVAGRLGLATFLGPQNGQMLPYLHCAGAAIAAGKLLGLDGPRLSHALAVALAQPPAALWPSFLGSFDVKVLVAAHATAMGVWAAELAAGGFRGALDLLDHPRGFFHRFTFAPIRRALGGLGRAWLTDTLQVKPHAACWYYQALLDGILDAIGGPLPAGEVRAVRCRVTLLAEAVDASERARPRGPLTANEVNFAIPTAVASAILVGRLHPDDLTAQKLAAREPEVRALASRITVEHDWALSGRLLGALDAAIDLGGLVGDLSLPRLLCAAMKLRHEFPQSGALDLFWNPERVPGLPRRAPTGTARRRSRDRPPLGPSLRALASLIGRRGPYDLGAHDLSQLALPIPGAFEIELAGGRRIEGEREVSAGALTLPDGAAHAAAKLRASAPNGDALAAALAAAREDTPLASLLAHL
jgi:2-methylcitrate dehydratase PrpD